MFVIPKNGLTIMDPATRTALPAEGRNVGGDHPYYWDRHRQDGSVEIITDPDKVKTAVENLDRAEAKRQADQKAAAAKAEAETSKAEPAVAKK